MALGLPVLWVCPDVIRPALRDSAHRGRSDVNSPASLRWSSAMLLLWHTELTATGCSSPLTSSRRCECETAQNPRRIVSFSEVFIFGGTRVRYAGKKTAYLSASASFNVDTLKLQDINLRYFTRALWSDCCWHVGLSLIADCERMEKVASDLKTTSWDRSSVS